METRPLLGLPFNVRPATADDAVGIFDLTQRYVQYNSWATRDAPKPLGQVQQVMSKVARFEEERVLCLVAEASAPRSTRKVWLEKDTSSTPAHSLLGTATVVPFAASIGGGPRSSYNRTASLSFCLLEGASLEKDECHKVGTALIRGLVAACQEQRLQYRTIIANRVFHADIAELQEGTLMLQEEGFRVVGMLEDVIEKNGRLLHRVTLQRSV